MTSRNITLAVIAGLIVLLVAVVVYRTESYQPPAAADLKSVKLAAPIAIDVKKAAQHLGQAVQFQTVSHQNKTDNKTEEWDKLHAWLSTTYPAINVALTRETVKEHALLFTWKGSDPSLKPIILMAHQDVVPVTPGSEKNWKYPPFSGAMAENAVWGRGSIDDKGSLIALMEAVETLAAKGFKPKRTVYIVSGHDEEVRGGGALAVAQLLKSRGVKAEWVLDEGGEIEKDNPIAGGPVARISIAEKGYGTLRVTVPAQGGHSSTPPKETGVVTLSKAILAIANRPYPSHIHGPIRTMFEALAPYAPWDMRMEIANLWLFEPLLIRQLADQPSNAAMFHTTIAPTMLQGSPKENVLPQDATAWINFRFDPNDRSTDIMRRTKEAVGDLPVTIAWDKPPFEPSRVSSMQSEGWKIIAALAGDMTHAPVVPGMTLGGTDSWFFMDVSDNTYLFQPVAFTSEEFHIMIHGTNEHMPLENLGNMIQFYARLIETAAG